MNDDYTVPAVRIVDPVDAFVSWVALGGNYPQTAIALRVDESELRRMAITGSWEKKAPVGGVGAVRNREISRAVDFVQATQLRGIIDRMVLRLNGTEEGDRQWRVDFATEYNPKGGANVSMKNLKILGDVMITASTLAARGLGDDAGQRDLDRAALKEAGQREGNANMGSALHALASNPSTGAVELVRQSIAG